METYVTSLRGRVTHLGDESGARCGFVAYTAFYVSAGKPPDRPLCAECARRADRVVARDTALADREATRDAVIVGYLREGLGNDGIARRLRLGQRTTSRYVNGAMRRAGARTRFEWGHKVGFAAGRATR
jgi:DNA-binding CsgD family transcriptional regulator